MNCVLPKLLETVTSERISNSSFKGVGTSEGYIHTFILPKLSNSDQKIKVSLLKMGSTQLPKIMV
jgi:hypothetical protein